MEHNHVHAFAEIVEKGGSAVDSADKLNKAVKVISATQAFRQYDWLKGVPVTNVAGDLRGMVLSAKWNAAFQFTVKAGKKLDTFGKISSYATLAVAIASSYDEVDQILQSKDPWNLKAAQISTQVTGICMNFLTGIVTAPTHAVLSSLPVQSICAQIDLARGKKIGSVGGCQWTLKAADTAIQSAAQQVSDGNQIYLFVNTTLNPMMSRMLGSKNPQISL